MKRLFTNERGVTLIELLAVFVIGSLVILLLSNTMTGVQTQYKQQSAEAESIFDVTYAAKVITRDFRMSETVTLNGSPSRQVTFIKPDGTEMIYDYKETEQIVYKNDRPFIREVTAFTVSEQGSIYAIKISNANGKSVETELIQR